MIRDGAKRWCVVGDIEHRDDAILAASNTMFKFHCKLCEWLTLRPLGAGLVSLGLTAKVGDVGPPRAIATAPDGWIVAIPRAVLRGHLPPFFSL